MTTVCEYLIEKLYSIGVSEIFGVPGDFNFEILSAIEENPHTHWIGCCNELNASYACEGYGRIKGAAACVTTYGVGELSAINGIAGAYAQNVPVIQITGMPKTEILNKGIKIHHSFADGRWNMYFNAYKQVSEYTVILNTQNASLEIQKAIHIALTEKKPVYMGIPQDVAKSQIKISDFNPDIMGLKTNAAELILDKIKASSKPLLMFDSLIQIFNLEKEAEELVNRIQIPFITTTMGKGCIDEENEFFAGVFEGSLMNKTAEQLYCEADLILAFGLIWTDFNIGFFSLPEYKDKIINIRKHEIVINTETIRINSPKLLLDELIKKSTSKKYDFIKPEINMPKQFPDKLTCESAFKIITNFLQEKDVIIAETGMSSLGIINCKLPKGACLITQALYSSIGWALPAAVGAAMADTTNRTILFTGDGSLQLTVQEISSMCRYNVKPLIFILNNDGYTIERLLSETPESKYNDIAKWNWQHLADLFCTDILHAKCSTTKELRSSLRSITTEKPVIIEIILEKMDMPPLALKLYEWLNKKS